MKRLSVLLLFVLIILQMNYISANQQFLNNEANLEELFSDNYVPNPLKETILKNSALADKNNDKIADNLNLNQDTIDALLLFEDKSFVPSNLDVFGLSVGKLFNNFPILNVKVPASEISSLTNLPGLALIEDNVKLESFLSYSTSQFGVRPYVWDLGARGSHSTNIAVIDSGIDYTHPAFTNKIIASFNLLTNNLTDSTDDVGHGTFVSHVAAGALNTGATYTQSTRGVLPANQYGYYDIVIANLNETTDITMQIDWANIGQDNPSGKRIYYGLQKWDSQSQQFITACGNCIQTDNTGLVQTTFSSISAGDYFVVIGSDTVSTENEPYELEVTLPHDSELPNQVYADGYAEYDGVAPEAGIVALKVTDSSDSGTVLTFLDAMDWVINNHNTYNISVVNLSIGILQYSASMDSTVTSLTYEGVVVVVAAGNDGANSGGVGSPASAEEAITVGAVNRFNEIAFYSSNGDPSQSHINLIKPDVVAPGGSQASPGFGHDTSYDPGAGLIVAADANGLGFDIEQNDLIGYQGTSFAAPHVAGLALLLVNKLKDLGEWTKTQASVYRVKRAILAGTFEVANIGSNGGEGASINFPNQTPSLNRISKDYVEGWGAVSAQAAFGALTQSIGINTIHYVKFGLEDPFTPNVYAWNYDLDAGVTYNFMASVPDGADIDLLVFEANGGQYGDLNLLASSTNGMGTDEELSLSFVNSNKVILVARLFDSTNQLDESSIQLYFPNFVPHVEFISPTNNSYISTSTFPILFDAQSSEVELYIDGVNQGVVYSEHEISGLAEGTHNLTLIEKNLSTGDQDVDTIIVTIDLTNPILTSSEFLALNGQTINDSVSISFSASDNIALQKVEILVDNIVGSVKSLEELTVDTTITFNPTNFRNGSQIAILRLYDRSGRYMELSINIQLDHQVYLIPHFYEERDVDTGDTLLIWEEYAVNPLNYSIFVNDSIYESGNWDGTDITFDVKDMSIGLYEISLILFDSSLQSANDTFILKVFDGSRPRITSDTPSLVDANEEAKIIFYVEERFPLNYTIFRNGLILQTSPVNLVDFSVISVNVSNTPSEMDEFTIKVMDTSYNEEEMTLTISWQDDVIPIVTKSDNVSFEKGNAKNSIDWSWIETFPDEIVIFLDGAFYNEVSNPDITSFSVTTGQLNSLSAGDHEYRLRISDLGGNVVTARILVEVTEKNNTNQGFISSNFLIFLAILPIYSGLRKKRT